MPKMQVNDNGVIRTLKRIQVNDNGIIRELNKVQANDNGIIRTIFQRVQPITVSYTGEAEIVIKNETQGYAILKTAGTFTFTGGVPEAVDIYAVGRGGDSYQTSDTDLYYGVGGRIKKYTGVTLPKTFTTVLPISNDNMPDGERADVELYNGTTLLYSSAGGNFASAGAKNTTVDFWNRSWASGGGNKDSGTTNAGGSNGEAGVGRGGGSSPIGGGGGGSHAKAATKGPGGTPNGAAAGKNSSNGGGAGGATDHTTSGTLGTDMGKATGGGGNGGALGGGGGGLGGGGGGYNVLTAAPKDMSRSEGAQGGGGVFIIRWGNSPL